MHDGVRCLTLSKRTSPVTTLKSWSVTAVSIIVLLCLSGGTAFADPLSMQGSTSGTFYLGSVSLGSSIPVMGLSFTGSNFGPTSSTQLNLGTFNLSSLLAIFNPFDFKLTVNFTAPAGTTGNSTFSADLYGAVVPILGGFAKIDFISNGPRHFEFSNSHGSGSFDLAISDVTLANGQSKSIKGTISNATFATTPEPTSIVLISTLLGGVMVLFRKRLRSC
jgi:hypothetical protein